MLDFARGLRQLRICGKLQEVEGITQHHPDKLSNHNIQKPTSFCDMWRCNSSPMAVYRMTRLMQILQLFLRCERSTFKTFFAELRFFLDPIRPEFCQLGEIQ